MPINSNPAGTLIRGETVIQNVTLAEGELLGYVWDTAGGTGWAVIAPHTGTFTMATNAVIGQASGAFFNPLVGGTLITYVREVVLARDSSNATNGKINGQIGYICVDNVAENAQLFSVLATQTGCTATIPPGGGGTNNAWPTRGIICRGTTSNGYTGWVTSSTTTFVATNNGQTACLNATPATGITADGSFYVVCSNTSSANVVTGFIFTHLDDCEPGDVDPYVFFNGTGMTQTLGNWANTSSTATTGSSFVTSSFSNTNFIIAIGYAARGCPVTARDVPAAWVGSGLYGSAGSNLPFVSAGYSAATTLLNHPATSPPALREPVALVNAANAAISGSSRQFKGRCRWIQMATVGTSYDTYDTKAWLVVNVASSSTVFAVLLPYDSTTVPTQ
jgi:hypothetical protein